MAKKSRRARRAASQVANPVRITRPSRPSAERSVKKQVDFRQEYHYVVQDLKRIAIIAAGLMVLLVVLAVAIG